MLDNIYILLIPCMLYNLALMVRRLSLSTFRTMIREVVDEAAHGGRIVLTHYKRDVAAIVPLNMVNPPIPPDGKKKPTPHAPADRKRQQAI